MNKNLLLVLFICVCISCNSQTPNTSLSLKIEGNLTNLVSGKVYLERMNERNIGAKIDSVLITGKTFVLNTKIPEAGIYQLNIANEQLVGLILDGGESLKVNADGSSTPDKAATFKIEGSANMDKFNEIQKTMQQFAQFRTTIEQKFQETKSNDDKEDLKKQYQAAELNNRQNILPKIEQLGTSLAGIIAANNFMNPDLDGPYLNNLKDKLLAEGKNHFFAKMFIQAINQKSVGTIGSMAPDFNLKTIDGKSVKLSELRGKKVIVDFWATWCGPCIMSFPGMKQAIDKYKDNKDVVFVFVDTFERVEPTAWNDHVAKFVKNRGLEYLNPLLDIGNQTAMIYGVEGIPAKFCIDKEGKVKHKGSGYAGSADAVLKEMIEWIEN